MRFLYILIAIVLLQSCEKKSLSEKEILNFIHTHEDYKDLELKKDFLTADGFIDSVKAFKKTIKKQDFKSVYETDFNNDGKMDYLVNLTYSKVLDSSGLVRFFEEDAFNTVTLLSGEKGYQLLNPGKRHVYDIFSAKIITFKNQKLIKLVSYKRYFENKNDILQFDTLMIKNNELTEYIKPNKKHKIEKIIFTQNGGYAPGRIYQLAFNSDSIILTSDHYKNFEGKYFSQNKGFYKLSNYINHLDFSNLQNRYYSSCSDCPSVETTILYDNGKTKTIYDYGEKGTLGLVRFYEKIDSIMNKQRWLKTN